MFVYWMFFRPPSHNSLGHIIFFFDVKLTDNNSNIMYRYGWLVAADKHINVIIMYMLKPLRLACVCVQFVELFEKFLKAIKFNV